MKTTSLERLAVALDQPAYCSKLSFEGSRYLSLVCGIVVNEMRECYWCHEPGEEPYEDQGSTRGKIGVCDQGIGVHPKWKVVVQCAAVTP